MTTARFDEPKLREDSLIAFVKALHSDRMVAVTGSMATLALGYPSWRDFKTAYGAIARTLAKELVQARGLDPKNPTREGWILDGICARAQRLVDADGGDGLDDRVSMWMLHDGFRTLDDRMRRTRTGLVIGAEYQPPALERFESRVASLFASRTFGADPLPVGPHAAAVHELIYSLGIKRIATLNYDLELERAFMLRDDERKVVQAAETEDGRRRAAKQKKRAEKAAHLKQAYNPTAAALFAEKGRRDSEAARRTPQTAEKASVTWFMGPEDSGKPIRRGHRDRLSRTMGNGILVESDIVDRERPDRLFEFAIGSSETGRHILHIHGRADVPDSLVAHIRQYDRLYRLDDLYRDPFDHSLRVLFGGNPILFVGIGMSEAELNQTLQYFVSNAPVRRPSPMFLIWNTNAVTTDKAAYMEDRRLNFRRRLGVHVIFEEDLDPAMMEDSATASARRFSALADDFARLVKKAKEVAPGDSDALQGRAKLLAGIVECVGDKTSLMKSSSAGKASPGTIEALPATLGKLPQLVTRLDARVLRTGVWRSMVSRLEQKSDGSPPGPHRMWGAEGLRELANKARPRAVFEQLDPDDSHGDTRPLIFAVADPGFGRGELGERLVRLPSPGFVRLGKAIIKLPFISNRLLINAGFSYDSDAMLNGLARFLAHIAKTPPSSETSREQAFANGRLFDTRGGALVVINGADRFFSFDGIPLSAELDHMLRCAQRQLDARVQFLLLGTDRLGHYCEALGEELQQIILPGPASMSRVESVVEPGMSVQEMVRPVRGLTRPVVDPDKDEPDLPRSRLQKITDKMQRPTGSSYLDWVAACFLNQAYLSAKAETLQDGETPKPQRPSRADITPAAAAQWERARKTEPRAESRSFFDAYLSPMLLQTLGAPCPQVFEILRTMCFIGAPIEAAVLLHAPKVRAILSETEDGTDRKGPARIRATLRKAIQALLNLGLIIEFEPHEGMPTDAPVTDDDWLWTRFGLHRSLAGYLRDRHGAPINDAKLATTFNMSLFMSEPSDNYTPEPNFHDELGDLVDNFIGAWHDVKVYYRDAGIQTLLRARAAEVETRNLSAIYVHPEDKGRVRDALVARSSRVVSACLRAALSLVRGYYSTSTLLKLDRDGRIAATDRDGALTEHAQRLERMIAGFGDIAASREIVASVLGSEPGGARARDAVCQALESDPDKINRYMGPDPFYADDLVWLHNERGAVALAQGHLFDARESFGTALWVNGKHVEHRHRGHNWRRISLNLIATRIERGALQPAERLLDQIEGTVNKPAWRDANPVGARRIEAIREMFARETEPPVRGNPEFTREEMLVTAMATGYRGLIAHVRGKYPDAAEFYVSAIGILRRLGEQRAYAHFQRHYASLLSFIGDKATARREIEFAIAAAQSAKQMDILHRSRIVRSDIHRSVDADPTVRRHALQDIKNALTYSALSDCYRARIEASASLARHMRHGGDYDTALRYAADALTIASRYGHSLQKTSLRIEIAQILIARGDPQSGQALLRKATAIGSSKGNQQALESVRRAQNTVAARSPIPNRTDITVAP
jgi:tetratricopeptide (TPR) repeat protein